LLAYLDDTLEPAQAKLIGQKIAESPQAQELMGRIREVVRRRRLTTPPDSGPGEKGDANTTAEYIDSVLPADQLAQVEELCLESDVHLAEIAACHQVLTIVLSRPYNVPSPARQRMYNLIQGREAIPYRKPVVPTARDSFDADFAADSSEADETLLLGLPFFRGRSPSYWPWLPTIIVSALAVALGIAIWQAIPAGPATRVDGGKEALAVGEVQPSKPEVSRPESAEATKAVATVPVQQQLAKSVSIKTPPSNKDTHPSAPAVTAPKPSTTPPPAPEGATAPSPTEVAVNVPPASAAHKPVGQYAHGATPTILLHRGSANEPWQRLVRDDIVQTGDHFVSLPGYRSEIRLSSGVELLLWGDIPDGSSPLVLLESAGTINDSPDVDLDITLARGRISIANHKPQGAAKVRVRFHKQVWGLTLLENGTEVAMELVGFPRVGFVKETAASVDPDLGLGLFVLHGQTYLRVAYSTYLMSEPPGTGYFSWTGDGGPAPGPRMLEELPPWARKLPARGKEAQAMREAQDKLASQMLHKAGVEVPLQETLKDKAASSRILAVYSFGAIDDLTNLVEALGNEAHREVRLAAITTLRHWLGLKAEHDQQLFRALDGAYRPRVAELLMNLLHPSSQRQAREPETYEALIAYLKHEKIAVRELAHLQLVTLVPEGGKKISYDPAGTAQQREHSFQEWKKLIPSGKLPPEPAQKNGTDKTKNSAGQ
jgi:hypothetical protein